MNRDARMDAMVSSLGGLESVPEMSDHLRRSERLPDSRETMPPSPTDNSSVQAEVADCIAQMLVRVASDVASCVQIPRRPIEAGQGDVVESLRFENGDKMLDTVEVEIGEPTGEHFGQISSENGESLNFSNSDYLRTKIENILADLIERAVANVEPPILAQSLNSFRFDFSESSVSSFGQIEAPTVTDHKCTQDLDVTATVHHLVRSVCENVQDCDLFLNRPTDEALKTFIQEIQASELLPTFNEVSPKPEMSPDALSDVRACVSGLLASVESNCKRSLRLQRLKTSNAEAEDELPTLKDGCSSPSLATVPQSFEEPAKVEPNVADSTHKTVVFNDELGKTLETLFNLISDLPVLFGPPFFPENCPADFAEKFSAAFFSCADEKSSAIDVIGIYRRLICLWMRLERIDPFDLREPCSDAVSYFGAFDICTEEKDGLVMIEAMFEKMPNATDRLIARRLLAAVAKTGADVLRKLISERGNAIVKQDLVRPFQLARSACQERHRLVFSKEKQSLFSYFNEFHGPEDLMGRFGYGNLLLFDRRSVAFTLYLLPLYMANKGCKGAERSLACDLEASTKISQVNLYARFKRKRKISEAHFVASRATKKGHSSEFDEKGLLKVPPYHLVKFVKYLPAKIAVDLARLVSESVDKLIPVFQSIDQPCAPGKAPRAFTDMRSSLFSHINDSAVKASQKELLAPHHACSGLCMSVLVATWDTAACSKRGNQLTERSITRMKREAFFAIAQTVRNLTQFVGQQFAPYVSRDTSPKSFEDFCFVCGSLLAHLYLLLYSTSGERSRVKVLVRKVHDTLAACIGVIRPNSAVCVLSNLAPKYWFHRALVISNRIVVKFSYILSLQPEMPNKPMPFGTLPADSLLNCPHGCLERALKSAVELKSQTACSALSTSNQATILTRCVTLRKRAALYVTLAVHLIENSSNYDGSILSLCFAAIAKWLVVTQKDLKLIFAFIEKVRSASDPSEFSEWSKMASSLSETDRTVGLVLAQIGKYLPSLKSSKVGGSAASRKRKEIELFCFQKSVSNCFQKWDPFWRFFLADLIPIEFPSGVAEWLNGVESLRPPHFNCDTESKICHLAGIVLALSERSLPNEPANLTQQRPLGSTPLWVSAEAESRMIKETTNLVAASSCSPEVLDVLKFHANWLVRLGIQNLVRKRTLGALGGTLFTSAYATAYLGQIEAELKGVDAECARDFSRFADLYRHSLNNSVEWAEFSDLGWTFAPMRSQGVEAVETGKPVAVPPGPVVGPTVPTAEASAPAVPAFDQFFRSCGPPIGALFGTKFPTPLREVLAQSGGLRRLPTVNLATAALNPGAPKDLRMAAAGLAYSTSTSAPSLATASVNQQSPGNNILPVCASSGSVSSSFPYPQQPPPMAPYHGGRPTMPYAYVPPPLTQQYGGFLGAPPPGCPTLPMQMLSTPVHMHPPGVPSSSRAPAPLPAPPGVDPGIFARSTGAEAASYGGETSSSCFAKTGLDEGIIELSIMPSRSGKRGLSSAEMDGMDPKRGKSDNVETNQKSVFDYDKAESSQADLTLVTFPEQLRPVENALNQFRNRLIAEFGDPDYLAKFFAGPSNSSEDILKRVEGVHYFATNPNLFEKSVNKFASRSLSLVSQRMSLKRALDQKTSSPELELAKLENARLSRRLAILRNLIGGQRMDIPDHLGSDLAGIVADLEPFLKNLRRQCENPTHIDSRFKAQAFEAIKSVFTRILPHEPVQWTSGSEFWEIVQNLKILGEAFLSRKDDIERISDALPRIEQVVADRDARIAELEAHLRD